LLDLNDPATFSCAIRSQSLHPGPQPRPPSHPWAPEKAVVPFDSPPETSDLWAFFPLASPAVALTVVVLRFVSRVH